MEYVYRLTHEIDIIEEPEKNDWIDLGVYSTQHKAEDALNRFRKLARFEPYQDGFNIDRCKINKDNWTDGFFTYQYDGDKTDDLPVWIKHLSDSN